MKKFGAFFIIHIFFLSLGTAYSQIDCKTYSENYIPKNLNKALIYLNCEWSLEDKTNFKNKDEDEAVTELHFETGLTIRNNWNLWTKKKNSLKRYFKRIGIFHPDDMSSIIMTSFHRELNNKKIDLNVQVNYYKTFWDRSRAKGKTEIKRQEIESKREFELFQIGDSVKIAFKFHKNLEIWAYRIQKYPDLNEKPNCYIQGVVKKKNLKSRKYGKYILEIQITDMCGYDNAILSGIDGIRLNVNQEYDFFSLMHFKITKK